MAAVMKILKTEPRELRLDGAVNQGLLGIVIEARPFVSGNADGKVIGVVGGLAGHGQHFSGLRVQRHHGALLADQGLLGERQV